MPAYYPAFVNISGKHCLVVGGGKVAERKVLSLLKAKAKVTVISDSLTKRLHNEHKRGNITFIQRRFEVEDLKDAMVVIAATSDHETNKLIALKAPFLVNVVDNPNLSNFIVPSVISRKNLTIAISTEGASPAIASLIRRDLDTLYGKDIGKFLGFIKGFRKKVISNIGDAKIRRQVLSFIASRSMITTLREEGIKKAKDLAISYYKSKRRHKAE